MKDFQKVIRDPGGDSFVRIITSTEITNGSVLDVPADSVAFFTLNGLVSAPYPPGRHTVNTGVGPFFVKLKNWKRGGDPGITVSVVYVATGLEQHMQLGSGRIPFKYKEGRYSLTMEALAALALDFRISAPKAFVTKLVGFHRSTFCTEDITPKLNDIIRAPIVAALSKELGKTDVVNINQHLSEVSSDVKRDVESVFVSYGIELIRLNLTSVNIDEESMTLLRGLEKQKAEGLINTDIEKDNLDRIYDGNIEKKAQIAALMNGGGIYSTVLQLQMLKDMGLIPDNGNGSSILPPPVRRN